MQNLVTENEKNLELERKNKNLVKDVENIQQQLNRLIAEKDQVRDIIRDEFRFQGLKKGKLPV